MSRKTPETDTKSAETITLGGYLFTAESRKLQTIEGETVPLRSQSAEVLAVLAARRGGIVSSHGANVCMSEIWARWRTPQGGNRGEVGAAYGKRVRTVGSEVDARERRN